MTLRVLVIELVVVYAVNVSGIQTIKVTEPTLFGHLA